MKKLLSLFLFLALSTGVAHADIFGEQPSGKLKAGSNLNASATYVDPGTILDYLAAITGYLGVREGFFYDVDSEEFANYLAATLYTIPDTGLSISVGALDTDGILASLDYNVGMAIPSEDVPLLNLLEYLYVGVGVGAISVDNEWELVYGPTAQLKFTF